MEDINVWPQALFLFGPMVLYVVIGVVVHLTYGKGKRGKTKEEAL